jgi:hypothetical protein
MAGSGAIFLAFGGWLASLGTIAVPAAFFVLLGASGIVLGIVVARPSRHGIHLDGRGLRTIGPAGPIAATYEEIAGMCRADLVLAPGVVLGRHLVLLEDGRHFFVPHEWPRSHQALACLAHRRFDAPPFDPQADDGPDVADRATMKRKVARLAKRIAAERK